MQDVFNVTCFWALSDSTSTPSHMNKQIAGCKWPHNRFIRLTIDLVALCDMCSWKVTSFGCVQCKWLHNWLVRVSMDLVGLYHRYVELKNSFGYLVFAKLSPLLCGSLLLPTLHPYVSTCGIGHWEYSQAILIQLTSYLFKSWPIYRP